MNLLTDEQERDLVAFVIEDFGSELGRTAFNEVCLQWFEDIAGFETARRGDINQVLANLWRKYHDKV